MAIKSQYQPGEHILVRLDNRSIVGKVIYCSLYFEDIVCVAFDVNSYEPTSIPKISPQTPIFYTGGRALGKISKRVGWSEVSLSEGQMTRRIVGGTVWVLDCVEGPATEPDLSTMSVLGYKLLLKDLNRIFGNGRANET